MSRILIVDDEQSIRQVVAIALRREGHDVVVAEDGETATKELETNPVDVVISDIKMPGVDGLDVLRFAREHCPKTAVILMTAYTSTESAIEALRLGAYDYISKPFEVDDLVATVARALERRALRDENVYLRRELAERHRMEDLVGRSPAMKRVFDLIERLADSDISVLITGESGTGKELVARALHQVGERAEAPFVTINSAAVPAQLLESELFGHVRGSFTGAERDKPGLFVEAEGGTLMLDEIGDMPLDMQPKLLRVLEDHKVRPVGATKETAVNVRVLAATNRDLQIAVDEGSFRQDLFYRLNVMQIELPPLRERIEDVPLLAEHFLAIITAADADRQISGFSREAKELIEAYTWPGNVRELENAVRRAATLETGTLIAAENLPEPVRTGRPGGGSLATEMQARFEEAVAGQTPADATIPPEGLDLEDHLEEIRRVYMRRALAEADGVQKKAAGKLGMTFRSFRYYLDKLGLRTNAD